MVVTRSKRPRRWLWIIFGAVLLVVVFLIVEALLLVRQHDAAINSTSTTLDRLMTSLDLFEIEYAKVEAGTPLAQTSAAQSLHRAQEAVSLLKQDPFFYKDLVDNVSLPLGLQFWDYHLTGNGAEPDYLPVSLLKTYAQRMYDRWTANATATPHR